MCRPGQAPRPGLRDSQQDFVKHGGVQRRAAYSHGSDLTAVWAQPHDVELDRSAERLKGPAVAQPVGLKLGPIAGVRWLDVKVRLQLRHTVLGPLGTHTEPVAHVRLEPWAE